MNCREVSSIAIELARRQGAEQVIGTTSAQDAVAHAGSCEACAALMAEQRDLSQHLGHYGRASASPDVSHQASLPIEAALRSAFRQHQQDRQPAMIRSAARPPQSSLMRWAAAVAAIFLVSAAGYLLLRKFSLPEATSQPAALATRDLSDTGAKVTAAAPVSPSAVIPEVPKHVTAHTQPVLAAASGKPGAASAASRSSDGATVLELASNSQEYTVAADEYETTSEFVPLLYGGDPMLAGSGPVVRVEMSGAVLQSLGFPIAGEPSARRVKADLMLGEDGVARAIRFVQ